MQSNLIPSVLCLFLLIACNLPYSERELAERTSLEHEFQQKLDSVYQQNENAVGAIIHVEYPDKIFLGHPLLDFLIKKKWFFDKSRGIAQ